MNAFSQDTLFLKAEFIKGSDTLRYRYLLPEKYDDGGYTGANTDRPALQKLIADIKEGKINLFPQK